MILEKIWLGLSLSAPFGPLSAEAMRRGLNGGFSPAFQTRFGGAIGNTTCLVLAYFFLSFLMQNQVVGSITGLCCSFLLILLGYKTIKASKKNDGEIKQTKLAMMFSNCLLVGFILSIANPFGIVWWLGVFAPTMLDSSTYVAGGQSFGINLFIIVGVLIWVLTFSFLVAYAHKILNKRVIYWVNVLAGFVLASYGVKYAYKSIVSLMELLG